MKLPQTIEIRCTCGRRINVTFIRNPHGEPPVMIEQTSRIELRGECADG